jgi:hypothetical protein
MSNVRPHVTEPSDPLPETLVVVERDGLHCIEIRQVFREGESCFVLFARSDGTETRVAIDGTKLKQPINGQVPADLVYHGGAIVAPHQEV